MINFEALIDFVKSQKEELEKDGWFKTYTTCKNCGTKFIFKNNNLQTKKVCTCQSNDWQITNVVEV